MNKRVIGLISVIALVAIIVIGLIVSLVRVKPGYAGVVYNLRTGMENQTLRQGWHFVAPTERVTTYPISMESVILSKKEDGSFTIPTSAGKTVDVDLEASISFNETMLPVTFSKFRGKSSDIIINSFIIPKIKAWTAEVTSQYDVLDIYGDKRNEINNKCLSHLQAKFKEFGINVDAVNFTRIEPDKNTLAAIQLKVDAQQKLEQEKIEKDKAVIEAQKKSIQAEGEAKAKLIQAQGESKANLEIQKSLTPQLIQKMEMEARQKWGWVTIQGGTPIVDAREGSK